MNERLDASFPRYADFGPAAKVWCVTPGSPRTIHRFFDTSPISPSGRYLAATRLAAEDRLPAAGDVAEVLLVDLHTGEQRVVAETRAADTQLGAQVQWGASDAELCFNDVDEGDWLPFGVSLDPKTGRRRRLAGTVYMLSPDGRLAVSACLRRIRTLQAGYGVLVPPDHVPANSGAPDDDGVSVTDTHTGRRRMIAPIRRIVEAAVPASERGGDFYCFHTKFSPTGERIMLVLRRMTAGGGPARSQLITMRADGEDIRLAVPAAEWADKGGHHPNWCPDGEHVMMNLALAGRGSGMKLIRARYDGTGLEAMTDAIPGSGHPSLHRDGRHVITDCYQGEPMAFGDGTTPLRWIDLAAETETTLARIHTRPDWAGPNHELRVDPHPAWDRSGRYVAFNAWRPAAGTRGVFVADVSKLIDPERHQRKDQLCAVKREVEELREQAL